MKAVKVTYTVQEHYADQNKENIQQVMQDLRAGDHPGIRYSTYVLSDGVTFVHLARFRSEEDNKTLSALPSFQSFQQQLKASQPTAPPKAEPMELVGASHDIFG